MTTSSEEMDQTERDRLMSQAYTQAQRDLRSAHKKEFDGYYQARCAERGIEWTPKRSKEEVALDTILDLLTEYPSISEQLASRLAAQAEEAAEGAVEQDGTDT